MKFRVTMAILLASGFVTASCFNPVSEPIVHPTIDGGGDAGDAGPSVDGGPARCTINGSSYADGDADPQNPCLICRAARATSQWTDLPDSWSCGNGQYCFAGICGPGCPLDAGFGGAIPAGRPDYPGGCHICGEDGLWRPLPDGTRCKIPVPPGSGTLMCFDGVCQFGCFGGGNPEPVGTPNPENSCQYCGNQSSGWTTSPPGTPCADGGICDLSGNCGPPVCTIANNGIADQFPHGTSNPADPSLCCNPSKNATDWSPRLVLSQSLSISSDSSTFTVGDFNHDGWPDLAVVSGRAPNFTLSTFVNLQGVLQPAPFAYDVGSGTVAIAALDLNDDGYVDLVVGDTTAQTLTVWTASPWDGSFSPGIDYPAGPTGHGGIQGADFNGDGAIDVVSGTDNLLYFPGTGQGGLLPFTLLRSATSPWQQRFAVGDLNGDHSPDITLLEFLESTGNVFTYLGNGTGGFNGVPTWTNVDLTPNSLGDIAEGDLDGDGFRDIALSTIAGTGGVTGVGYLPGFGDGTFGAIKWSPALSGALSNVTGLAIGDLENDGKQKVLFPVLTLDANQSRWVLYEFDAVSGGLAPVLRDNAPRWPLLVDFNNDGARDLVGAGDPNISSPSIAVYLNGCP